MDRDSKYRYIEQLEHTCDVMRQYARSSEAETELYDTITQLQNIAYKMRNEMWSIWVEGGILEEMRPPVSK